VLDDDDLLLGLYLQSAPPRDILARMLRNLKEIFRSQNDRARLLDVMQRLLVLLPECWPEYRDRGTVHADLGHTEQALADWERYLAHTDDPAERETIALRVRSLRRDTS